MDRDRTLYYLVVTSLRLLNLVLFIRGDVSALSSRLFLVLQYLFSIGHTSPNQLRTVYIGLYFTIGLGSTLISRVVLNIRRNTQAHAHAYDGQEDLNTPHSQPNAPGILSGRLADIELLPTGPTPSNIWEVPPVNSVTA